MSPEDAKGGLKALNDPLSLDQPAKKNLLIDMDAILVNFGPSRFPLTSVG